MREEWKSIDGFPQYTISNHGRVYSLRSCKYLKARWCGRKGEQYPVFGLSISNKLVNLRAHRLVAHHFIGPCPPGYQVNHIDSNRFNPRVDNLEYVTPSQNTQHSYDFGPRKSLSGERNPAAKLTDQQVAYIRALYVPRKYGQNRLAREFGVTQAAIWHIVSGSGWKEVR